MFSYFECALSTDKHFCRYKQKSIPCGHWICQNCIPKFAANKKLRCKICKELFDMESLTEYKSDVFENEFKINLKNLFLITEKRLESSFKLLSGNFNWK